MESAKKKKDWIKAANVQTAQLFRGVDLKAVVNVDAQSLVHAERARDWKSRSLIYCTVLMNSIKTRSCERFVTK